MHCVLGQAPSLHCLCPGLCEWSTEQFRLTIWHPHLYPSFALTNLSVVPPADLVLLVHLSMALSAVFIRLMVKGWEHLFEAGH